MEPRSLPKTLEKVYRKTGESINNAVTVEGLIAINPARAACLAGIFNVDPRRRSLDEELANLKF
jgi:hypothetical protein